MAVVIILSAIRSRERLSEVRHRLVDVQSESLQIAERFRHSISELGDALIRYRTTRDPQDWEAFQGAAGDLDAWIDRQKPRLNTPREKEIMLQIDRAYDVYRAEVAAVHDRMARDPGLSASMGVQAFAGVRAARERLGELGAALADAHRERINRLLADANESAARLGVLLLGSLALLLLFGTGFGVLAYRDLIAPLRVKLVESQALVERHEKLASLGMLAAGVAHEIRNPLTAIKATLYLQLKKADRESPERSDLRVVEREIVRLERIVNDFLCFARPSPPVLTPIAVAEPLFRVERLLRPVLEKRQVQLLVHPVPEGTARMDPEQIHQVLINLVQNSSESIKGTGRVTIGGRILERLVDGEPERVVLYEVTDTGGGIPPEVEKRLFDPFFSTKSAGTGLGLSIASRIVQNHGGDLEYQTQVGHGTTFGVRIPLAGMSGKRPLLPAGVS